MPNMVLLDGKKFQVTIQRLCYQLIENHINFDQSAIIGIQPRGVFLAKRIIKELHDILPQTSINYGNLDITFFRDDFRRKDDIHLPSSTEIDFIIEDKKIILVDDVLWTGRTARAALDAILVFGRPCTVELLTLVDRRYSRQLPIQANYVGLYVDTVNSQKIRVHWEETDLKDEVILTSNI